MKRRFALVSAVLTLVQSANAASRPFLMGTSMNTDFFEQRVENPEDKDLVSMHLDDFLGVPWSSFQNNTTLPASWVANWDTIRTRAAASGKVLYLAVSPLHDRKTLTGAVDGAGSVTQNWAPTDSDGCYTFASDASAETYKQAYIRYCQWLIDRIHPAFFSPAIEMSVQFTKCPAQKAAFISWYSDVHRALKQANPSLVIFPTFQMEHMYGTAEAAAWCGGTKTDASLAACFQQHLDEALAIPADRIAFSTYPWGFKYPATAPDTYTAEFPYEDTFRRVENSTHRKVWISETGWPVAPIYTSYQHASPASSCGTIFVPSPTVAGEANLVEHMRRLLAQAQAHSFEGVVWWENRDLSDAATASSCPCAAANETCSDIETLYGQGGTFLETVWRIFSTMGLRQKNGTPRTEAYALWKSYLDQGYQPASSLNEVRVYPNPLRPARGHRGMTFVNLPSNAHVQIFTMAGEKVKNLSADVSGNLVWDGRNDGGLLVASGVYLALFQTGGQYKRLKIAVQR